ncbi:TonB-dependent receptor [Altericroceibacterium spongiae]|uniref:TonB-dependent receptor n=1 Tax=Altericroceibacterium spongiae TaxID=2320269 RepID=A0A420EQW0_9SPHN|nr:TonB-dependent receptor [Altericroceibacterium spongiae]RKF23064.1 TonB-dependent receptor [Altericroceibacterium spongiae]
MRNGLRLCSSLVCAAVVFQGFPAIAQDVDVQAEDDAVAERHQASSNVIVVSARKREETDLEVPVVIRALGTKQLEGRGIQTLQDVAATTPSLNVSGAAANSGGTITLRGIGTPPTAPGTDQAVAVNIDGVTIADGMAVRLGQFDLQRVEVLQGPQSLYFGKNSSAGIISIVSADPTDSLYMMLRTGYGFEANEILTEAVVSAPLTDQIGGRLAFYRSEMDGYFKNPLAYNFDQAMPTEDQIDLFGPISAAPNKHAPAKTEEGLRATLKFENDDFVGTLKGLWAKTDGSSTFAAAQLFNCQAGVASPYLISNVAGLDECELDKNVLPTARTITAAEGEDPLYGDGTQFSTNEQILTSADLEYSLSDFITLSSNTSYYDLKMRSVDTVASAPYALLGSTTRYDRDDFQQELRLNTDFDSAVNGLFGVYYQNGTLYSTVSAYLQGVGDLATPEYWVDSRTYSIFGQINYQFWDEQFEISAGGRFSDEKKNLRVLFQDAFIEEQFTTDEVHSKRFSPEIVLSYRPDSVTNVFLTYKKGSKSGGFTLASLLSNPYVGTDISFSDEKAEGFEGGIKTVVLDGDLRFDLTGYRYDYDDLQVTVYDPTTAVAGTRNAATARIYGVQFNANYSPRSIPGFNLGASVNYGHARFRDYFAGCYVGQTQSDGCVYGPAGELVGPDEVAVQQDLSGEPLTAAPDWAGNVNTSYEFPVGAGDTWMGLSASATYQDRFEVVYNQPVGSSQAPSINVDASIRLFDEDDKWELALIGKNLTNNLRARWGIEAPFSPGSIATNTGSVGTGYRADLLGITNAPRTFMLRLTLRPFGKE